VQRSTILIRNLVILWCRGGGKPESQKTPSKNIIREIFECFTIRYILAAQYTLIFLKQKTSTINKPTMELHLKNKITSFLKLTKKTNNLFLLIYITHIPFASANYGTENRDNIKKAIHSNCLEGIIEPEETHLNALQSSLFSTTLYEQGDPNWKPTEVAFYVKDTQGNAIPGCEVDFSISGINDGVFYPNNSVSDVKGRVSGWWISGNTTTAELVARLKGASHISTSIVGEVSNKSHRNLAPATYLGYGSLTDRWSEFNIDITPTHSTKATYFKAIGWSGGYTGIQQVDDGDPNKLIFSVWKSDYGMAELIEGSPIECKSNTDSAEGDFVQCFIDYPWEINKTYNFNITAKHNVSNAIDYKLLVTDKQSNETKNIATIRVPQENNFYPGTPSSFIEQFAYDQYSCKDIVQRSALYSSIWRIVPETGNKEHITSGIFSRPYDTGYGHGSLCFNYAYGSIESLPVNRTNIKEGFYLSTGGDNLISKPADGSVGINYLEVALHPEYYIINQQDEFNKVGTDNDSYLNSLLRNKNFISVETSDRNWIPQLHLPIHATEGNIIKFKIGSTMPITVFIDDIPIELTMNSSRSYIYHQGGWVMNRNN